MMAETLWDAITDLLAPEAGRRRRAALDRAVGEAVMGLLGPTGIPERLAPVAEAVNPVASMERAGQASQRVFDPSLDRSQRIAAGGEMLSEMAGTALPGFLAARYGAPAAQAIEETLLGFSQPARDAGSAIVERMNQPGQGGGPVTLYSNPFMRAPDDALPLPRNEAEAMAKQVLEMRAAGRAGDVTDEMMAAADPQYMYANTPLPMDEASRMARARGMGFDTETLLYHGTGSKFDAFDESMQRDPGFWFTTDRNTASNYAHEGGDLIYAYTAPRNTASVEFVENEYGDLVPQIDGQFTDIEDNVGLIREAQKSRLGTVEFPTGNFSESDFTRVEFDPTRIRRQEARFDPEFRHLRNLSAGFGGLGLLAYPEEEQ